MPKPKTEPLYIGVGGHVVALDPKTGEEIWRTKLRGRGYIVTIDPRPPRIFAGCYGEVYCLDAAGGEILWHNKLTGLGLGVVAFPGSSHVAIEAMLEAQRAAAAANAAT